MNSEDDVFMRFLTLLIPLTFIFGGIWAWIAAIRGKQGKQDDPWKANISEEAYRKYRKKEILTGSVVSLGMIIFGGWLLYCWLFGPVQR